MNMSRLMVAGLVALVLGACGGKDTGEAADMAENQATDATSIMVG